jgi:hypothetical protein
LRLLEYVIVPIIVALITAGIPALLAVRKWRRENADQHAVNLGNIAQQRMLLETIHHDVRDVRDDVKQVRSDLDRHIGEHEALMPYRRVK